MEFYIFIITTLGLLHCTAVTANRGGSVSVVCNIWSDCIQTSIFGIYIKNDLKFTNESFTFKDRWYTYKKTGWTLWPTKLEHFSTFFEENSNFLTILRQILCPPPQKILPSPVKFYYTGTKHPTISFYNSSQSKNRFVGSDSFIISLTCLSEPSSFDLSGLSHPSKRNKNQ